MHDGPPAVTADLCNIMFPLQVDLMKPVSMSILPSVRPSVHKIFSDFNEIWYVPIGTGRWYAM